MRPRHVLFVVLMIVTVAALLPIAFGVDVSSCDWHEDFDRKGDPASRALVEGQFGLSVKAGDAEVTKELRAAIEERLRAGGITTIVDNPVTRPRADIVIEEARLRWLPFYASVATRERVLLTRQGRGADASGLDSKATLDGTCLGLVSPRAWRARLVDHLADQAAHGILPER
ncbi:MAG: hypothetical protein IT383_21910 [Deltaproteobacteria bacterium]|nr:hypothetical protein [Deltaproteobacteria bacterium]